MRICIIGGGLTGLSAAYYLSRTHSVDVLEASAEVGGLLSSSHFHDTFIERYYHHCFSGDANLLALMDELDLSGDISWLSGSTGYFSEGRIYPLTTPFEILRYPLLTLVDKFRLGLLTLRAGKYQAASYDDITADAFIQDTCGKHAYESFFAPLLRSKFGEMRHEVSAAWLISRIAIRSDRGPQGERLGYLRHGYQSLITALSDAIRKNGGAIHTGIPARALEKTDGGKWRVNGAPYDVVISTVRPSILTSLGGPSLPEIPYQGAACVSMGLSRDVLQGIYWVNVKDEAPYGAVIGHTNFAPFEWYGEHIVYLASYFRDSLPEGHEERMITDFCERFGVSRDEIRWHYMTTDTAAGPVYITGYRDLISPYEVDGIYCAGMFSLPNYPERSMEGSVVAAQAVAEMILSREADRD
ncbi:NAD(P)/FAD-dependent oxidoreductase [Methanogenium marinum]|uniref:NAD(P)/FAD-dependent oxidoreductase n=1 Tax=Methanogenium marinum TaxID=348610 RepID=A0A9Q4KR94_9EURY|nr:NAD(P)/FAD-dependent oxidoreductase [Methanogenium marinum]MDE4908885.1 NAD(P)/FAD-dependent oxidoreductase [Methanogenium marinum]